MALTNTVLSGLDAGPRGPHAAWSIEMKRPGQTQEVDQKLPMATEGVWGRTGEWGFFRG